MLNVSHDGYLLINSSEWLRHLLFATIQFIQTEIASSTKAFIEGFDCDFDRPPSIKKGNYPIAYPIRTTVRLV